MDVEQSKGSVARKWISVLWQAHDDEIIIVIQAPSRSPVHTKSSEKSKGIALPSVTANLKSCGSGVDKIEFQHGGPFIRSASRRGI